MEMHQVRYFLAVCRTLNFTKAAEECNVAQPSLTRAIQKLEDEFGGLLFHRERANTHLTELGKAMLPHMERTYEAAQSAKQLATSYKKGDVVHLRVGISPTVSAAAVTNVLGSVRQAVSAFELTLDGDTHAKLLEDAVAGDLDLIVVGDDHELPERVRAWTLHREPLLAVMPKEHKLANKKSIAIADLHGVEMIVLHNCPIAARLMQVCAEANVTPKFTSRATNCDQVIALVREGLGIATLPATLATDADLVAKPVEDLNIERAITLGTVAGRRFSPASDAFVKLARARDWGKAT
jgi:LysR family transcriptional regulator, hydrogen peroxide-inducible genes activator